MCGTSSETLAAAKSVTHPVAFQSASSMRGQCFIFDIHGGGVRRRNGGVYLKTPSNVSIHDMLQLLCISKIPVVTGELRRSLISAQ